jgi:glycine cleavage system transcriptional repressor
VSVYGVDHPGIVHAVSKALAERGISITDLEKRLAGGAGSEPVYAMLLEVAVPPGADAAEIERDLADTARHQQVELSFRPLELDAL